MLLHNCNLLNYPPFQFTLRHSQQGLDAFLRTQFTDKWQLTLAEVFRDLIWSIYATAIIILPQYKELILNVFLLGKL